jgi:hypothetical protein
MSNPVPPEWSRLDAVRNEDLPTQRALPDFEPVSPIDRAIARSERASAALAAAAAVARAAFTDSQLQAEAAAAEAAIGDIDTGAWVRTEYASLDHALAARSRQEAAARLTMEATNSSRNPVIGTFDPGLTALNARVFPGSSIANARPGAPGYARGPAQARFLHEARLTPRAAKAASTAAPIEEHLAAHAAHYDKPEVMPMLATPMPAPRARVTASRPSPASEPAKLVLAACMGAAIVLIAGGAAWKSGALSRGGSPSDGALVTSSVVNQAETARALAAGNQELQMAPPAAGARVTPVVATTAIAAPAKAAADVDAILAAAARVTAPPEPKPPAAAPVTVAAVPRVVAKAATPSVATPAAALSKDSVAAAIASAQARADRFLAANATPAATSGPAVKQEP